MESVRNQIAAWFSLELSHDDNVVGVHKGKYRDGKEFP